MLLKSIKIKGLRGFEEEQTLELAVPNNTPGSGLTTIVGPNNTGKSTIFESFLAISSAGAPTFTEGKRNKKSGDRITITVTNAIGKTLTLATVPGGGSITKFQANGIEPWQCKIFALPSRRAFAPFFQHGGITTREDYLQNYLIMPTSRIHELSSFSTRVFKLQDNLQQFNQVLEKVIHPVPKWNIEQSDTGGYYIRFEFSGSYHTSEGAGEGLVSIFTIVDALYDSNAEDTIYIDEPELSLHPSLQRKLAALLLEYSKDRQIIVSTHSPFFIDWFGLINGGNIARTSKENGKININLLSQRSKDRVKPLLVNLNNPHILGLNANEVFFLEDNVVLVEGTEDVIFYKRILGLLGIELNGQFFGWGAGGATNIERILSVLHDLGFKKVAVILDNNVSELLVTLRRDFPNYYYDCIPTDDVRDKPAGAPREAIIGLIDQGGKSIKPEYEEGLRSLFKGINESFY